MKKLVTLLLLCAISTGAFSQISRVVKRMYFDKDTTRKSSFVILPVLSSAPETGLEVGGAGLLSFYTDTSKLNTRVSNVFAYATITTKGQSRLSLTSSYWTPGNTYHLTAGVSYINFPFDFYGIGNNTLKANSDRIGQKRFKVNFAGEKKITDNLYAGINAGAWDYHFSDDDKTGIFYTDPRVENRGGGPSVYIGPTITFDNRNNNTYTTKGLIIGAYFQAIHGMFGNNDYKGGFFNIEYSQFFLLAPKWVLGLDVQEQSLTGSASPFYLLPDLGSDELMRGYYNGRFRDRNMIAGQAELRYRLSNRIGFAGFVGTGEVFKNSFSSSELKPNYGGGLRYFFDVQKGLAVRVDYGVGQKIPNEKRLTGFYIGLGQSF
ncbi:MULTISPECIES: polymerase [Mucilaginibacter]|uniref:Polymerase n=1 Tax=Mucilaginibacter rubeus TaxID=2027860 RepID=A0A5C1I9E8_9SPHI|nr:MULTISPECIES: polymerase [Mucilaginibacter]QEM13980.1 polymerase [Mucilaginibacter rubeus]